MRTILILLTFIVSLNVQAQKRPTNIVIIFIDDMGYADIGPFGAKGYDRHHGPLIEFWYYAFPLAC